MKESMTNYDRCPFCNFESNREDLIKHINSDHFLSYNIYAEIMLTSIRENEYYCYRCNKYRSPVTNITPTSYYQPCWKCVGSKKSEKLESVRNITNSIKDFQDKLLNDRYLQLFISNDNYFNLTLPHDYENFRNTLSNLKLPLRSDFWYLNFKKGFPKIISIENLNGLEIVNVTSKLNIESTKDKIIIFNYTIHLPDIIPYDTRHHSRYSILNLNSDRKTKRLRFQGTDNCIKFFNTKEENVKSILKITSNIDGSTVDFNSLSELEQLILKLVLLRNKTYMRQIFDVVNEMTKSICSIQDLVFLKNTVQIDITKVLKLKLSWSNTNYKSEYINLTIF